MSLWKSPTYMSNTILAFGIITKKIKQWIKVKVFKAVSGLWSCVLQDYNVFCKITMCFAKDNTSPFLKDL